MTKTIFAFCVAFLLLAGCGGGNLSGQPTLKPGQIAPPTEEGEAYLVYVEKARALLAKAFNRPIEAIVVIDSTAQTWPNGCLGLPQPEEMCTEAIVPGYLVILEVNNERFAIRTDAEGEQVRSESALPEGNIESQAIADLIVAKLAGELGIDPGEVVVSEVSGREWTDGCLNVAAPGTICPEMMVPGFIVLAEAGGKQYEFHTNLDGTQIIQARPPRK